MKISIKIGVLALALPLAFLTTSKVVTHLSTAQAQGQTPGALLLNGDFSQAAAGSEWPQFWQVKRERGTQARVSLQAPGARSAPAALHISVERGTARVQQTLPSVPVEPCLISGYAKASSPSQNVLGILQVFGAADDKPLTTLTLPIARSAEWKEFSQRISLPPGAARAVLVFEVNGAGEVALDDISITRNPPGSENSPNNPAP